MRGLAATLLALLALGGVALANLAQVITAAPPAYSGIQDATGTSLVVYGSCAFAVSAAYATGTNPGCNYIRASDSHTCDTLLTTAGVEGLTANCSTGGDNGQSLASWLTSTTGKVVTVYDQSGALDCAGSTACSPTQGTGSKQPVATLSGLNGNTLMTFLIASAQALVTAGNMTVHAQPITCYVLTKRAASFTTAQRVLTQGTAGANPEIAFTSSTNTVSILSPTSLPATASDNTFHVVLGLYNGNGSNSINAVDNTETTGAAGTGGISAGKLTVGAIQGGGSGYLSGPIGEFGCWVGALSAGNRTAVNTNVRARWGSF